MVESGGHFNKVTLLKEKNIGGTKFYEGFGVACCNLSS